MFVLSDKTKIIIVLGLTLLTLTFFYASVRAEPEVSVEIDEAFYPPREGHLVNATLNYTLINNSSSAVRIENVKLTSVFGGFVVGETTEKISSKIIPGGNITIETVIEEDWSMIPLTEQGLTQIYDMEVETSSFLSNNLIQLDQIRPKPRLVLPPIEPDPEPEPGDPDPYLDELYMNIRSGGPSLDGIPPIENPEYNTVNEADAILDSDDWVFVLTNGNETLVYPRYIMVWHEIVNEKLNGDPVSITYCPLTGSAIGYYGNTGDYSSNFGTSGKLLNSNLVMYDRETGSYWPQILGVSIRGVRKGERLPIKNIHWVRWEKVKEHFPDSMVLNESTGHQRPYGEDPYGDYNNPSSYYNSGEPFFNVMNKDERLPAKEVVVGVKIGDEKTAIHKLLVRENKVIKIVIDRNPVIALYDNSLDVVRVFSGEFEGRELEIFWDNGKFLDSSGLEWSARGESEQDRLRELNYFDVMWFAWAAFYPETDLVMDGSKIN